MPKRKTPWARNLERIDAALRAAKRISSGSRYGGLAKLDKQLAGAIEVVEELRDYPASLLEPLAALEHDQWAEWAKTVMKEEAISEERAARWETLQVPYHQLPGAHQDSDRAWAKAVIEVIETGSCDLRRKE